MDTLQEIISTFLATVPNAGLLILFPIAAAIVGVISTIVTAIGASLDEKAAVEERKKLEIRLMLEHERKKEDAEARKQKKDERLMN